MLFYDHFIRLKPRSFYFYFFFLDQACHVEFAARELCECRLGFFFAAPEITCCAVHYRGRSSCASGMLPSALPEEIRHC